MKRVVITGAGIISVIGNTLDETSKSLQQGKSGITIIPEFKKYNFRSHVGGQGIDALSLIPKKIARFMPQSAAYCYLAAEEARKMAGLELKDLNSPRVGVVASSGGVDPQCITLAAEITKKTGPKRIGPFQVPIAMSSCISANLTVVYKTQGISYSISSACTTSLHSVGHAYEQIAMDKQDIIIAGGGEIMDYRLFNLFDAMGALSSKYNDTPTKASRPFDKNRDGFIGSGGGGIVIVESYDSAKARGANILAEIIAYHANSDGSSMVSPSGEGAGRCIRNVMEQSKNIKINYINPHATSTPIGDAKEAAAIKNTFGIDKCPPISATKSMTGHSLGATGVQEIIFCLIMMRDKFISPSINIDEIDDVAKDLPIIQKTAYNKQLSAVLTNNFGFGGTNASMILKHIDA